MVHISVFRRLIGRSRRFAAVLRESLVVGAFLLANASPACAFNLLFKPASGDYVRHDNTQPIAYSINLGAYDAAANRADLIQGIRNAFEHIDAHPSIGLTFAYQGTTTQLPATDAMSVVYLDSNGTYVAGAGVTTFYNVTGGRIISADIAVKGPNYVDFRILERIPLGGLLYFVQPGFSEGEFIVTGPSGVMVVRADSVGPLPPRRRAVRK